MDSATRKMPSQHSRSRYSSDRAADVNFGSCFGTVGGVMDTVVNLHYDLTPEAKACLPEIGIKYMQAVRIVTKYLTEHLLFLHEGGAALAIRDFREAYPCK